ncbi:rhomboid family intramembrane serine protease [Kaistia dalseonensis]|uniref:Membrane associated rhomboid family serine protease n=1 Tax=Kaistia dalseonensis TaxID=410840 RepID=A0ABU0H4C4_9HYPH|nr:rhomboid family intramembrane serine protease [Kaistia dalseonensis]MCX5494574.1 rhomboid family intramembrane serine protease [Kaistia dalseonensis]MDQ0437154.1 membrane associated rhomboid family serine protease [Kaistia dalseonensis]
MFVPLHDQNPLRYIRFPWVTRSIVVLNVLIFLLYQGGGNAEAEARSVMAFGLIPSTLAGIHVRTPGIFHAPEYLTFITSSFLHGDVWHLAGNMLFLWVFGDNVEDAMGPVRFLVFYLLCAIGGGLAHVAVASGSDMALIGASGSVAGVIAAYLILHPRVKIWILLLFRIPLRLRTVWVLGFWILWQVYSFLFGPPGEISWAAHLGGFLTGAVLILVMRRRGVPLLARDEPALIAAEPVI